MQAQYSPYEVEDQVILLHMAVSKVLLDIPEDKISDFNMGYLNYISANCFDIKRSIRETGDISVEQMNALDEAAAAYKAQFMGKLPVSDNR